MSHRSKPTFEQLEQEYNELLDSMVIKSNWAKGSKRIAQRIAANKERYEEVSRLTGGNIPWQFIGVIHNLECGLSFSKHLHNGDSLKRRTRRVPANRPRGHPPFSFEESAVDALTMKGFHEITDWSMARMAFELEKYNGWGYRMYHPSTLSPYLWSGTTHYRRGKYIADGKWSSTAVSAQGGAMPILSLLYEGESIREQEPVDKQKLAKNSRKMSFIARAKATLAAAVPAGFFSWQTFSDVKQFVTDNAGIMLLVLGVISYLVFKYFEVKTIEDYEEGRYTPSGEEGE